MLHANFLQRNLLATNAIAPCGLHSAPDCRSSFAFTFIHRYILLLISFDFRLPIKLQSFPEHVVKAIWTGKNKKKKNMEMKMTVPVQLWRYFSVKCEYGKIHKFVYFLSFFFLSFFKKLRVQTSNIISRPSGLSSFSPVCIYTLTRLYLQHKNGNGRKGSKVLISQCGASGCHHQPVHLRVCVCVCLPGITQP
jgi:hypothetical protein